MGLVHKSASTLQYLDIGVTDPSTLLYDAKNDVVVYPKLQHLHMSHCVGNDQNTRLVPSDVVSFPVLRSLKISQSYKYFNEVLFRGNNATLEYLEFTLCMNSQQERNIGHVFENVHTALHHVILLNDDFYNDNPRVTSHDELSRLLNNLVSNAKRFVITSSIWLNYVIVAAQQGHGFQNIRVLETKFEKMSMLNVLSILKALPAVTRLRSGISGMDPSMVHIAADELPDHIVSTYGNMGSNLQVWEMTFFNYRFEDETIDYILLLALVCPSLSRVELISNAVPDYHKKITEVLESGPYSKYASQLSRVSDIIYE
ncbi:hypothetical protein GGF41_000446 [Coemansia sp. RSA 2531]|nr:hypothetical protein GGF41_000446 [Coemansia sp. RSA 2531]